MALNIETLQQLIDLFVDSCAIEVLEAGCGSASHLSFGRAHITGIDISKKQLERNTNLKSRIHGNIETYDFSMSKYDIVICWDVLEHLSSPKAALVNMFSATAKNGLIIIAAPSARSLKGMITKFTPHWFHIWVYRYLLGNKNAGREDTAPFRTFLRNSVCPEEITKIATSHGLEVIFLDEYESSFQKKMRTFKVINFLLVSLNYVFSLFASGKRNLMNSDFIVVLKK